MARPKIEIDAEQVEKLAMLHCTNVEMADFFGVDEATIRRNFAEIITKGKANGKMSLRRAQYNSAIKNGNVTMQIWLGKQILGQKETMDISIDGLAEKELTFLGMPKNKNSRRFKKYTEN